MLFAPHPRPNSPQVDLPYLLDPSYAGTRAASSSSSCHGSPRAPSIYLGELHDPDYRMFPTIAPNSPSTSTASPPTAAAMAAAAARHRSATHPPASKRRRTAFNEPVYAADWLNVQDMDADDDEDEDDDSGRRIGYGAFPYNPSTSRRSTAPPSPLPAFNHLPLPNHSAPAHICDYSSPSHSPRPPSHLSMLSDASSIHDDDEHYASATTTTRRRGLLKYRWSHSHLRDEEPEEDEAEQATRLDEEPVEIKAVALTADDTVGDHPTPTCAHALKRQYHALSFRLQLAIFRTKKRVNARLRAASDAGP